MNRWRSCTSNHTMEGFRERRIADLVSYSMLRTKWTLLLVVGLCLATEMFAAAPSRKSGPVTLTDAQAAALVLAGPHPVYPIQARRQRISGSGLYQMIVDKTGKVTRVRVISSTGSEILDRAAVQALSKWRFKPGKGLERANLPITFSL